MWREKEHLHWNQDETLLRPGSAGVTIWLRSLRKEDDRRLLVAEMSCMSWIRGRNRREKVRNEKTEVLEKRRLLWFGLELDQYISSTHNRPHIETISDRSMLMFQDEDTHWIHRDMSSIGHPCSTVHGSTRYLSLMRPVLWPRWSNNHYPMPGLIVVINLYKLALLQTPYTDKTFQ